MAQTKLGAKKIKAKRAGLTLDEYVANENAGLKYCTICNTWKPLSDFWVESCRHDGLSAKGCIPCRLKSSPYPGQRERKIQKTKGFSWCSGCKTWLSISDVHAGKCRPCHNEYARKHYAESKTFRHNRIQKTTARRGIEKLSQDMAETLTKHFGGKCAYCNRPATEWDHIHPVAHGGDTTPGNVAPACKACNSSKRDTDLHEWLKKKGLEMPSKLAAII